MKKKTKIMIASLLSAAAFTLSCPAAFAAEAAPLSRDDTAQTAGDVDGDGQTTSSDALMILRHSVGLSQLTDDQLAVADIDADGDVTSADALAVLRTSVGIVEGSGMEMARDGAYAAIKAVENGDFPELLHHTTATVPSHENAPATIGLIKLAAHYAEGEEAERYKEFLERIDKNDPKTFDDLVLASYNDGAEMQLMYLVNNYSLSMGLEKFGNECPDIEFTDGEQIDVDYDTLMAEINAYKGQLVTYSVFVPAEGVEVTGYDDSTIKVRLKDGRDAYLEPYNDTSTIDLGEPQKVQLGNMYKFKVKINGEETDKTARVVYVDGDYRIMDADLMAIIG